MTARDCTWFAVIWLCFRDVTTQGRALQSAASGLSPAYGPSLTPHPFNHCCRASPKSNMPLCPLHYKSDCFTSICSASLFFPSNISEVKAVSSSHSICTYTNCVKESDAKTSERKHPLDKSWCINMHNRRALSRRARSSQSTVFPITKESI